jgi:methyl-accepting chemotaxis protein
MTIGKKLTSTSGAMLLAAIGLAVSSLYSIGKLGTELDTAVTKTAKKIVLAEELGGDFSKMRACQRGVMLYSVESVPEKVQTSRQEFEALFANVEELMRDLKPLLVTEQAKRALSVIENEVPKVKTYFDQIVAASAAGKHQDALTIGLGMGQIFGILDKSVADVLEAQKTLLAETVTASTQQTSAAKLTAWILLLVALGVATAVLLTVSNVSKQLRGVTADLAEGAGQITSASSQVASSSQGLAQGASEQAASLEETSASSEEITSMTRKNAENSQSAASMMSEVERRITEGNQTLGQMVTSMTEITASSSKISKIIKVIDEIAFQTNILALNAAVEAARAGEAGMGFAVVADEVRNLAQRSAQAAKDTAELIEDSIGKSNEGSTKLQQVTGVIQAITESATKVKTLVDEVNLGSQEQARGIEQISKAITQMDQVTQSTAANAEESASASEEMSAQAEALKHIVEQLRSLVGGDEARLGSRARPSATVQPIAKSLTALKSAVTNRVSNPVHPAVPAGRRSEFPMEDNFIEM